MTTPYFTPRASAMLALADASPMTPHAFTPAPDALLESSPLSLVGTQDSQCVEIMVQNSLTTLARLGDSDNNAPGLALSFTSPSPPHAVVDLHNLLPSPAVRAHLLSAARDVEDGVLAFERLTAYNDVAGIDYFEDPDTDGDADEGLDQDHASSRADSDPDDDKDVHDDDDTHAIAGAPAVRDPSLPNGPPSNVVNNAYQMTQSTRRRSPRSQPPPPSPPGAVPFPNGTTPAIGQHCWLFDTVKKRWLMVKVTDILRKRGKGHRRVAAAWPSRGKWHPTAAKSVEFMRQVSLQTSAHDLMRHNDSPVNLGAPRDKPRADWPCDQRKVYRQLPIDLAKLHPPPPLDGVPRGYSQPGAISELDACKVFRQEDNMWYDGTIVHIHRWIHKVRAKYGSPFGVIVMVPRPSPADVLFLGITVPGYLLTPDTPEQV
jgi:hypothetical protein